MKFLVRRDACARFGWLVEYSQLEIICVCEISIPWIFSTLARSVSPERTESGHALQKMPAQLPCPMYLCSNCLRRGILSRDSGDQRCESFERDTGERYCISLIENLSHYRST